jgi:hypothetical protein
MRAAFKGTPRDFLSGKRRRRHEHGKEDGFADFVGFMHKPSPGLNEASTLHDAAGTGLMLADSCAAAWAGSALDVIQVFARSW